MGNTYCFLPILCCVEVMIVLHARYLSLNGMDVYFACILYTNISL